MREFAAARGREKNLTLFAASPEAEARNSGIFSREICGQKLYELVSTTQTVPIRRAARTCLSFPQRSAAMLARAPACRAAPVRALTARAAGLGSVSVRPAAARVGARRLSSVRCAAGGAR